MDFAKKIKISRDVAVARGLGTKQIYKVWGNVFTNKQVSKVVLKRQRGLNVESSQRPRRNDFSIIKTVTRVAWNMLRL